MKVPTCQPSGDAPLTLFVIANSNTTKVMTFPKHLQGLCELKNLVCPLLPALRRILSVSDIFALYHVLLMLVNTVFAFMKIKA